MRKNKLVIGFAFNLANAGPSNFLKSLKASISNTGIGKTSYFINPWTNINVYSNTVRNPWNKQYIYRIDGIGHDSSKTEDYIRAVNSEIIEGVSKASGVVFQSDYSKQLVENILGLRIDKSETIINGTDLEKFTPHGLNMRARLNIPEHATVFISSAKWRPRKRLEDMINVFLQYQELSSKDVYFIVMGTANGGHEHKNIVFVPKVDNHMLPQYLRSADAYLFLGWLDPCPNSVVEAIACKLPVICTNTGGTKEIISATNGGVVVDADDDYHFKLVNLENPPKPSYDKIISAMFNVTKNIKFYRSQIDTTRIDINYVALSYLRFIENCYEPCEKSLD